MKKTNCLFTLWAAVLCAGSAYAVGTAPAIFSQYGEIQSVKKYSSNPFWNKDSPYNQNFPKPIYATGADLTTGDCNRIVENLVTSYCAEHNYCTNLRISDVRPTIMVQLSQLPGHNFATSCGGYIDSAFENFQKTYGNTSTVNLPKTGSQTTNIEIANPFAPKQTAQQKAIADRTAELERLQSITTPTPAIGAAAFPTTTADLSFTDRVANTAAGYEQYKNMPSYRTPTFHDEDEAFFEKLKAQNFEKYCERRPTDPECKDWYCKKHPDADQCKKTKPTKQNDPNPVVNPPTTGCPEIADHRDPKTCQCYKSDFMDSADCKCRGESKWDAIKKKCVCPITDTSNLSIDELGYTTTMCDCRYNQIHKKYNSAKGMCEEGDTTPPTEEGDTTPPTNDKKYIVMQCRSKNSTMPNIGTVFDKGTNFHKEPFDCANNDSNEDLLKACFTACVACDRSGLLNTGFLNTATGLDFCTGWSPSCGDGNRANIYTFNENTHTKVIPTKQYTTSEKNNIVAKIDANKNSTYCCDPKRNWWIYAFEINADGDYVVTDRIKLNSSGCKESY